MRPINRLVFECNHDLALNAFSQSAHLIHVSHDVTELRPATGALQTDPGLDGLQYAVCDPIEKVHGGLRE